MMTAIDLSSAAVRTVRMMTVTDMSSTSLMLARSRLASDRRPPPLWVMEKWEIVPCAMHIILLIHGDTLLRAVMFSVFSATRHANM